MAAVYRDQRIGGAAVYGDGLSPQYTGTVADLAFASQLSTAAGTYTAPGAPAYNGTVDGLIFASALSTAAGSYVAPGDPGAWSGLSIRRIAYGSPRTTLKGLTA